MKKIGFLLSVFLFVVSSMFAPAVMAVRNECTGISASSDKSGPFMESASGNTFTLTIDGLGIGDYTFLARKKVGTGTVNTWDDRRTGPRVIGFIDNSGDSLTITFDDPKHFATSDLSAYNDANYIEMKDLTTGDRCKIYEYNIERADYRCAPPSVSQVRSSKTCFGGNGGGCLASDSEITIVSKVMLNSNIPATEGKVYHRIMQGSNQVQVSSEQALVANNGVITTAHTLPPGRYSVVVRYDGWFWNNPQLCSTGFTIEEPTACTIDQCSAEDPTKNASAPQSIDPFKLCKQIDAADPAYEKCMDCAGTDDNPNDSITPDEDPEGIWTAVGCIPREPGKIIQAFITVGLGVGGGFGLISTMVAGFLYSISAGDIKRTGQAKEMLSNSLIGLLFIIFSVTILQFIGFTVLRIPGFGG